jgi:hypothetical protein
LYLEDCLEILPEIGEVDAVFADPPYGVSLGEVKNGQRHDKNRRAYTCFFDMPEYVRDIAVPAVKIALSKAKRGIVTPVARNYFLYPPPDDMGVWFNSAGASIGRWGFILSSPILYYGKNPRNCINSGANSV